MLDLGAALPDRLAWLAERAGQGGGELALRRDDLDELVPGWRAASGRVAAAVVAAAFVVGLPLLAITRQPRAAPTPGPDDPWVSAGEIGGRTGRARAGARLALG